MTVTDVIVNLLLKFEMYKVVTSLEFCGNNMFFCHIICHATFYCVQFEIRVEDL